MDAQWIRSRCLALPGVTEDLKWEKDLCFLVGGRMFCVLVLDGPFSASLKVDPEEYDALLDTPDILPAPYLARYKWVQIRGPKAFDHKQWGARLERSYALVVASLPSRIRRDLAELN